MKITRQRLTASLMITFMVLMLWGCSSLFATTSEISTITTPIPNKIELHNPAYADAQATMDTGKSQLSDLSRQSTEVSLDMSKAASDAALSAQDTNRRQKMELDYQSTVISLNITQAAATQSFIKQQTKIARDATTAVQSSAATAIHLAYLTNVTQTAQAQKALDSLAQQTAQAQMVLYGQATQAAQAIETLTAYPLTATPFAVTQAALLMQKYDREQQSFMNQIVTPLIPILAVLDLVLFILIIIRAYRRFLPMPWSPYLRIARGNVGPRPLVMIDGVISDPDPRLNRTIPSKLLPSSPPSPSVENPVHVEIIDASELPIAQWISEVEHQYADEGGLTR